MDGLAHGRALIYGSGAARVGRRRLADPERILAEIHRLEKRLAVERDIEKSAAKIAQIYKAENDKTHKRNAKHAVGETESIIEVLTKQLKHQQLQMRLSEPTIGLTLMMPTKLIFTIVFRTAAQRADWTADLFAPRAGPA